MSERTITYWARVGKPVTQTFKQRFWKIRKDGVKQRYWKTVTRTVKKRKKITRRLPPKTRPVEYVRQFIFESDDTEYFTVDAVEVVDEPYKITDQEMAKNLMDRGRLGRMRRLILGEHKGFLPRGSMKLRVRKLKSGKGGARRIKSGVAGLRLEDLRRVGGR